MRAVRLIPVAVGLSLALFSGAAAVLGETPGAAWTAVPVFAVSLAYLAAGRRRVDA